MDLSLFIPAFIAGLLTFLAPCTFPLVPGYLGFISGSSLKDLEDPEKVKKVRKKIFFNGLFFVLGFSVIFIGLGLLAGALGASITTYRIWVSRVGGGLVIIFGLFLLGLLNFSFLQKEKQFHVKAIKTGHLWTSFILGASFGFGWTPCVGPILGSILLLASSEGTVLQGGVLLSVFSLGLAIPFLLIALGIGSATQYVRKISKYLPIITKIGGVFLVFLGILLFFDQLALLIKWGYQFFDFIGFNYQQQLLDYL